MIFHDNPFVESLLVISKYSKDDKTYSFLLKKLFIIIGRSIKSFHGQKEFDGLVKQINTME